MVRLLPLLAALCLLSTIAGADQPASAAFDGFWRQVATNAGGCSTCTLTVLRDGSTYRVTASNGWSVEAKRMESPGEAVFVGTGRWDRSPPAMHASRRLVTQFVIMDNKLLMRMELSRPDGSPWLIQAAFERELLMM